MAVPSWHCTGLRASTADVDTIERLTAELRMAVEQVARRHDLAPKWLNDHAAGFRPVTLNEADCTLIFEHPRLLVLGAALQQAFLMKLYASRAPDYDDLVALWPHCRFTSPEDAADLFHLAYPHLEPDPDLAEHILRIANSRH